jgi:hypothetical protein
MCVHQSHWFGEKIIKGKGVLEIEDYELDLIERDSVQCCDSVNTAGITSGPKHSTNIVTY